MVQVLLDTFTETSDTELSLHTPDVGGAWSVLEDTTAGAVILQATALDVVSPSATATNNRLLYTNAASLGSADTISEWVMKDTPLGSDDPCWLLARVGDASNYYCAGAFQDGANPDRVVGKKTTGTYTELGTANAGTAVDDVISFELVGNALKMYTNGGIADVSTTDSDHTSEGVVGIGFGNIAVSTHDIHGNWDWDDYEVNTVEAAGTRTSTLTLLGVS